jgi:hypothetical protein
MCDVCKALEGGPDDLAVLSFEYPSEEEAKSAAFSVANQYSGLGEASFLVQADDAETRFRLVVVDFTGAVEGLDFGDGVRADLHPIDRALSIIEALRPNADVEVRAARLQPEQYV